MIILEVTCKEEKWKRVYIQKPEYLWDTEHTHKKLSEAKEGLKLPIERASSSRGDVSINLKVKQQPD